jgi:hypothetical protein
MRKATDSARLVMDALQVLMKRPMDPVKAGNVSMLKLDTPFIKSSFENHSGKLF